MYYLNNQEKNSGGRKVESGILDKNLAFKIVYSVGEIFKINFPILTVYIHTQVCVSIYTHTNVPQFFKLKNNFKYIAQSESL